MRKRKLQKKNLQRTIFLAQKFLQASANPNVIAWFTHFPPRQGSNNAKPVVAQVDTNFSKYGKAPLHFAVIYNCIEIVELLIKYKANVNIEDIENLRTTPLHYAKIYKRRKIEKILLDAGANKYYQETNFWIKNVKPVDHLSLYINILLYSYKNKIKNLKKYASSTSKT